MFVTFTCFAIYSFFTWLLINYSDLEMTNYYALNNPDVIVETTVGANNPMPVKVEMMQILLITALLCSSDVVAAVSIVDYTK